MNFISLQNPHCCPDCSQSGTTGYLHHHPLCLALKQEPVCGHHSDLLISFKAAETDRETGTACLNVLERLVKM